MAKLELIRQMVKTTKNFWLVPFLKSSPKKRKMRFRNGVTMQLDIAGYYKMRDLFYTLSRQNFKVTESVQGFVVIKNEPFFSCSVPSLQTLPFFDFLTALAGQDWNVSQIDETTFKVDREQSAYEIKGLGDQLFFAKSEKVSFIGPLGSLMAYFFECHRGIYNRDYKGKIVLDIGGFCGETAVFFASQGATKVIIYEPVKMHHELIRKNMTLNAVNAELHEEGMGEKNGELSINYDAANVGFGLTNKGEKTLTIQVKSAEEIISQSHADAAKIDCEGAEISLVGVPEDTLRLVPSYIIETHTKAIQEAITKKFLEAGFSQKRAPEHLLQEIYVVYFDRI